MRNTIAEQLVAQGFHEIWSNSLTKASYYENTNDFPAQDTVKIFNPLSNDLNSMRQTLLFGGLEAIARNANRKNIDLRLFEFGNCYHLRGTQYKEDPVANYREEEHLALFLTGNRENPNWLTGESPSTFYLLKSYAENILTRLGFDPQAMEIRKPRATSSLKESATTWAASCSCNWEWSPPPCSKRPVWKLPSSMPTLTGVW